MDRRTVRVYAVVGAVVLALIYPLATPESGLAKGAPSLCHVKYESQLSIDWNCRRMAKGETLESVFGDRWVDVARFNRIDRRHVYPGLFLKIPRQMDDIRDYTPMPRHYMPAESEAKFILVDLSEQFLGAYEFGDLVFSEPISTGTKMHSTPVGEFRVSGYSRIHKSSLYQMENTTVSYPMDYSLRFYVDRSGVAYWIHGRDLPGYAASHGCIGLYDEDMQHTYYNYPGTPVLEDARKLFEWAIPGPAIGSGLHDLENGPRVLIVRRASRGGVAMQGRQSLTHAGKEYIYKRQDTSDLERDGFTNSERVRYQYERTPDMFLHRPYKMTVPDSSASDYQYGGFGNRLHDPEDGGCCTPLPCRPAADIHCIRVNGTPI